jgi:glutathione S-transferase
MRIYGTPPSHFTRKVRVLLQELGVPFEFVVLDKLLETGAEKFADNPLHMFPVLEHEGRRLIESDLICEYLIERFGANKPISTFLPSETNAVADRQRLAIINGAMSAGVTLIRAKRSGLERWDDYPYFRQELAAIDAALLWLDKDLGGRTSYYPGKFTMLEITLACLVEWAVFREFIKDFSRYPNLARFARTHKGRPSLESTHPAVTEVRK